MRKLPHYGFNLYKNGKFWFVVQGNNEADAVEHMLGYVNANKDCLPKLNNGNEADFTFREFANHSTDGFKLKELKNYL